MKTDAIRTRAPEIVSHVGLRGIAAMTVFLGHLQVSGLHLCFNAYIYGIFFHWFDYAVDLFFMLSGFIMCWVYVAHGNGINWRSFFAARAARILPLYYLTLILALAVPSYSILRHGLAEVGQAFFVKLLTNFLILSGIIGGWKWTIDAAAWSISVELFCYLAIFPALFWIDQRLKEKSLRVIVSIVVVGLSSHLIVSLYSFRFMTIGVGGYQWEPFWLGRGVFGFMAGFFLCCLYLVFKDRRPAGLLLNGLLLAALVFFMGSRLKMIPPSYAIYSFPFILLLTAFDAGLVTGFFKINIFRWLGERSYSIYLWQLPILNIYLSVTTHATLLRKPMNSSLLDVAGFLNFVLMIVFVLGISDLSYRYFESTLRKSLRQLWSGRVSRNQLTNSSLQESLKAEA